MTGNDRSDRYPDPNRIRIPNNGLPNFGKVPKPISETPAQINGEAGTIPKLGLPRASPFLIGLAPIPGRYRNYPRNPGTN